MPGSSQTNLTVSGGLDFTMGNYLGKNSRSLRRRERRPFTRTPPRQSWGRGPSPQGWRRLQARRSTCLLLLAVQRRRVESLVLGALSSSPVHHRVHVRGGGRCSEQFKTLLNRKKTHSFLNKSCVTYDSESIEHPSENHEKFGRYGTSGTCRGGGISSVKVRRAEIVPRSASEAACHPENTWGPSTDRSRATCAPKSP